MIVTLLLCAAASLAVQRAIRSRKDVDTLPGPSSSFASWIWGHELLVFQHEATQLYSIWSQTFGPFFKIKAALFHSDIIVAADHAAVQHIFADIETYVKSPAFRPPVANLIGRGLVWAEGEDHHKQRRILAPAFTPESVKGMSDDICECAEKLESRLTNHVLSNGGGVTVNIVEFTSACTLDIIGRVALGHDFKAAATPSENFAPLSDADAIRMSWKDHVNTGLTFSAFLAPLVVRAIPIITKAPLPLMQTQGAIKLIVRKLAGRLVENSAHGVSSGKGRDILSILLKARKANKESDEAGLTDEQILDNISTFTMVGHETTAGALNFTLLELARHPDVQRKLREEVTGCRDFSYDEVQKMAYLDAVVREGLRLHPASPQTERVALKDDVIPLSKPIRTTDGRVLKSINIKEGQIIHIPFTTMHINPAVWGPNATAFYPERWLAPGGVPSPNELPHGWSGLVSFCDGPRNCIGYRLAVFEFKVILATLIRSLEFHDTLAAIQQKISPTLQPVTDGKGGLLPLYITLAA